MLREYCGDENSGRGTATGRKRNAEVKMHFTIYNTATVVPLVAKKNLPATSFEPHSHDNMKYYPVSIFRNYQRHIFNLCRNKTRRG